MSSDTIKIAQQKLESGATLDALQMLANALAAAPKDEELYLVSSQSLIKAVQTPIRLSEWNGFSAFARQLLRHSPCPAPIPTLAQRAAAAMNSGNSDAIRKLVAVLADILAQDFNADHEETSGFKNILIFLLTTRALAGPWLDQSRLSQVHLQWFDRFTTDDLSLPYSTMFSPELYGANRDDLLRTHWPEGDTGPLHKLPPDRVLFLTWLTGKDAFSDLDTLYSFLDKHLPGTDEAQAAARGLLLHHRGVPTSQQLANWQLDNLATLATAHHSRTQFELRPAKRKGAHQLQNRTYQIRSAALNKMVPFLANRGKPKVAICLSGQLRGYEAALETWRKALLPFIEPSFFIHSWQNIGRSDAQPFRYVLPFAGTHFSDAYRAVATTSGYPTIKERYPTLISALAEGSLADKSKLQSLYETDHVILEDDTDAVFKGFSNQHKMHYKIHAADQLARGKEFDLFIRIRPDLAMSVSGFDWRDLSEACKANPTIFAEKPFGRHYNSLMCGDQCAVATPQVMQIYANTWETFPDLATAGIAHCPDTFRGHVSLAMTAWTHGIGVERLPIKFGALQEATPLSSSEIRDALEADSQGSAEDQRLIAAVTKDLQAP